MNKRLWWTISSALAAGCAFGAAAADNELFDDRYYVAPMGSLALSPNSRSDNNAFGGAVAVGKSLAPHFGVELLGDYLRYDGRTTTTPGSGLLCGLLTSCPGQVSTSPGKSVYGGGLGANYYLSPDNAGLFAHAGVEGGQGLIYDAGLGLDQPLFGRSVYLRAEALYHKESSYIGEALFHLGVRIPLGSVAEPAAPAPPPPVEVVPVEQPAAPPPEAAPPPPEPATCQPPAPGQPISLEGCKTGDTIVLHGVNFEFNKATLTVNAKTLLDQVADALLARKDIKVEIDGHTDGKGSVPYNQRLSEARAAAVMKYLAGRGIEGGRMSSKGFGKSMPIADNATEEGRELNRRVELKVTESGAGPAAEGQVAPGPGPGPGQGQGGASAEPAAPPSASSQTSEAAASQASASPRAHGPRHHRKHAVPAAEPPPAAPDNAAVAAPPAAQNAEPATSSEPAPAAPPDATAAPGEAASAPQAQAPATPAEPAAGPAPDRAPAPLSDEEARKIADEVAGGNKGAAPVNPPPPDSGKPR